MSDAEVVSSREIPEWLNAEELSRLCGPNVEWCWLHRDRLPCVVGAERFELQVRRSDLPLWLAEARRFAESVERRRGGLDPDDDLSALQRKYPGSANESRRLR